MQAEDAIRTERLTLLPSSDERDLGEYRRHLTDPSSTAPASTASTTAVTP